MKKSLILALLATAMVGAQAADAVLRADINGTSAQITLKGTSNKEVFGANPGWFKNGKEFWLCYWTYRPVAAKEWKNYTVTFTPAKTGKVRFEISGQWAKEPQNQQWLLINQIDLNGKLFANGNFAKVGKDKAGKEIPTNFQLGKNAKYLAKAGDKGTPAILTNFSNRLAFDVQVEAGKKYDFTLKVKSPTPELLK